MYTDQQQNNLKYTLDIKKLYQTIAAMLEKKSFMRTYKKIQWDNNKHRHPNHTRRSQKFSSKKSTDYNQEKNT